MLTVYMLISFFLFFFCQSLFSTMAHFNYESKRLSLYPIVTQGLTIVVSNISSRFQTEGKCASKTVQEDNEDDVSRKHGINILKLN